MSRHVDRWWARDDRRHAAADQGEDIKIPLALRRQLAGLEYEEAKVVLDFWQGAQALKTHRLDIMRIVEYGDDDDKAAVAEALARMAEGAAQLREIVDYRNPPAQKEPPTWVPRDRATKYGLTVDEGLRLLAEQEFRCAICRTAFATPKAVRFDHNHETGAFRGFLCTACNTGLGQLKDSPAVIEAAGAYLAAKGCYGRKELA